MYLERYVNDGSPSGFTDVYTTSSGTRPKDSTTSFSLCSVKFPNHFTFHEFGEEPDFFKKFDMLVHPDMIKNSFFSECRDIDCNALLVSPTSSARTVKATGEDGWFIKLHYDGLIGRFPRQIHVNNAQSAVEVSGIISKAIDGRQLPDFLYLMREKFARVIVAQSSDVTGEWGIVLREPHPYGLRSSDLFPLPGFSLFASDDKNPNQIPILIQLFTAQEKNISDFLLQDLFFPLLDVYFSLLLVCGLELEAQAQNINFLIDRNLRIRGIAIKDMESVDKDLSLIQDLNIKTLPVERTWKSLKKDQYNYQIMHSFMFDFKMGEYLVSPIISKALQQYNFESAPLIKRLKEHSEMYLKQLPKDFFPSDGRWYSYEKIVHDRAKKRTYISNPNPKYR